MKKLLFIVNTMGQAGAETALVALLKKLTDKNEFDISLYSMIPRGEMFTKLPKQVHLLNSRINNGSVLSVSGRLAILWKMLEAFFYHFSGFKLLPYMIRNIKLQKSMGQVQYDKVFWRLLAQGTPALQQEYDLAVAYIEGASVYYLADKVKAKRKASFIHIDYIAAGYHPMMDQHCYDKIDRIFVVSNEAGKQFLAMYPQYSEKVMLFRNIVDGEYVALKAQSDEGFHDSFNGTRLLSVGRLTHQKGYDIAVESVSRLVKDGYRIRWYIIGEGPERKALEQLISRHNVGDSFILLGAMDNPYPFMRQADIYVQPSRFEGWGIAIEEALILKKMVLASNCTGLAEQIDNGQNGILFTLGIEQLVEKLEWLIDHPQEIQKMSTGPLAKNLKYSDGLAGLLSLVE